MTTEEPLFSFGFATLNVVILFAFCNLAIFFSFYSYLATLPIPREWHGFLIGLFSVSALVLRPIIITKLTPSNAVRAAAFGLACTVISLLLYQTAQSFVAMALLRLLHGAAYVVIMSASVTLLMVFMPAGRSGQGFGIVTIMTLVPYAIVPYVLEHAFTDTPLGLVYACTALFMLPPALLLFPLAKQVRARTRGMPHTATSLPKGSIWMNVRQPRIFLLLLANGLVFMVMSSVFFFLKHFSTQSGVGDPGLFFMVATCAMITIRIFCGPLFDKYDKAAQACVCLFVFAGGLALLRIADSSPIFYVAAILYGLGVGAATPLMNGLMFTISEPRFRGLNTNLMLEMLDVGFFAGPAACGLALAAGLEQETIIAVGMGIICLAAGVMLPIMKLTSSPEEQ